MKTPYDIATIDYDAERPSMRRRQARWWPTRDVDLAMGAFGGVAAVFVAAYVLGVANAASVAVVGAVKSLPAAALAIGVVGGTIAAGGRADVVERCFVAVAFALYAAGDALLEGNATVLQGIGLGAFALGHVAYAVPKYVAGARRHRAPQRRGEQCPRAVAATSSVALVASVLLPYGLVASIWSDGGCGTTAIVWLAIPYALLQAAAGCAALVAWDCRERVPVAVLGYVLFACSDAIVFLGEACDGVRPAPPDGLVMASYWSALALIFCDHWASCRLTSRRHNAV